MKFEPRGVDKKDKEAPEGVVISEVQWHSDLKCEWKGMVLDEVNGEAVSTKSYNDVVRTIKSAGRPVTMKFCATELEDEVRAFSLPAI